MISVDHEGRREKRAHAPKLHGGDTAALIDWFLFGESDLACDWYSPTELSAEQLCFGRRTAVLQNSVKLCVPFAPVLH